MTIYESAWDAAQSAPAGQELSVLSHTAGDLIYGSANTGDERTVTITSTGGDIATCKLRFVGDTTGWEITKVDGITRDVAYTCETGDLRLAWDADSTTAVTFATRYVDGTAAAMTVSLLRGDTLVDDTISATALVALPFLGSVQGDAAYAGMFWVDELTNAVHNTGTAVVMEDPTSTVPDIQRLNGTWTIASNGGGGFTKAANPAPIGSWAQGMQPTDNLIVTSAVIIVVYLDFSVAPNWNVMVPNGTSGADSSIFVGPTNVSVQGLQGWPADVSVAHGSVSGWYAISVNWPVSDGVDLWLTRLTGGFTHGNVGTDSVASGSRNWSASHERVIAETFNTPVIGTGRYSAIAMFSASKTALELKTHVETLIA